MYIARRLPCSFGDPANKFRSRAKMYENELARGKMCLRREQRMCEHLSEQHPADTPAFYIQTPYTTKLFKPLSPPTRVATLQEFAYIFLGSGALSHNLGYCCAPLWMWVRNNRRKCSDNIKGCHILRFALIQAARAREHGLFWLSACYSHLQKVATNKSAELA